MFSVNDTFTESEIESLFYINGSTISSYFFCKRKAFYILSGIRADSDNFYIDDGKNNAEKCYKDKKIREVTIGHSKIDIIDKDYILEVKRRSKHMETDKYQLFFYMLLYFIVYNKTMKGKLVSNKEKKSFEFLFSDIDIIKLKEAIKVINNIAIGKVGVSSMNKNTGKHCDSCAFHDFCYAD